MKNRWRPIDLPDLKNRKSTFQYDFFCYNKKQRDIVKVQRYVFLRSPFVFILRRRLECQIP